MASEHRRWDARAVDDVGIHAGCMAADYHARQAAADLVRRLPDGPARLPRAGWTLSLRMGSVIGRSLSGGAASIAARRLLATRPMLRRGEPHVRI